MSRPADTPADVKIVSTTTRTSRCSSMVGSIETRRSCAAQCVVARRPRSMPFCASSSAPVQTEVTSDALAATRRIQASVSSWRSRARVPKPPGTTKMSIGGAVSHATVGITCRPPMALIGPGLRATVNTSNGALPRCAATRRPACEPGPRKHTFQGPRKIEHLDASLRRP